MPTYIYECAGCGLTLERRQSFSDAPLTVHEECGGGLRRVFYPSPIIFKGTGFYNTDYRSTSNGSSGSNGHSSSSNKDKKSDASDSKADAGASASSSSTDTKSPPSTTSV